MTPYYRPQFINVQKERPSNGPLPAVNCHQLVFQRKFNQDSKSGELGDE